MDDLRERFDSICSLDDVNDLINNSSISDGEYSWLELKGTNGKSSIGREEKKLFAKEICAFANTYGGILCVHKGDGSGIQTFEASEQDLLVNSIETWLRDSLEPPLQGMVLENRDGVFMVYIPMSKIKPHRSALDKLYYYRHNTMSVAMSELMISAMYRSQDFLSTSAFCSITKINDQQLSIDVVLINDSMIAGTKPKLQVEVLSSSQLFSKFSGPFIEPLFSDSTTFFNVFQPISNLNLQRISFFSTSNQFRENILYPKDRLSVVGFSEMIDPNVLQAIRLFVVRLSYVFLEIPRQEYCFLIDTSHQDSKGQRGCKILAQCSGNDKLEIAKMYLAASLGQGDLNSLVS